jgi:ABC-type amino acid transport substrate-binding protein
MVAVMTTRKLICLFAAGLFFVLCIGGLARAKQTASVIKVGISPFAPFVMAENGTTKGYAIDLWERVAEDLDLAYEYVKYQGVSEKLLRLAEGAVDVAIGGITVTEKREERVDFCHPHFQAGLDILIPIQDSLSFGEILASFFTPSKMIVIGLFLMMIIIFGHLIWLAERRNPRDQRLFRKGYVKGISEGVYWAIVTASTVGYGDKVARTNLGRFLTCFIIVASLPLFAFFIAELSSNITLSNIRASIEGPDDLNGKHVGVVNNTTSEDFMRDILADVQVFDRVEMAYQALREGRIEAVVYDQPNLLYYANHTGKGKFAVVGKSFARQRYGWALPQAQGSDSRREIFNRVLLALQESGELDRIYAKWFGQQ